MMTFMRNSAPDLAQEAYIKSPSVGSNYQFSSFTGMPTPYGGTSYGGQAISGDGNNVAIDLDQRIQGC